MRVMTCELPPYPTQFIDVWRLRDGRRVTVRPILPQDAQPSQQFVRALSQRSRHRRFHAAVNELTPAMLERLTRVDHVRHLALVAERVEQHGTVLVGEARFVCADDPRRAEFAIAVADDWQGLGMGRRLLEALLHAAAARGVRHLAGDVMRDNRPMLALAVRPGLQLRQPAGGTRAGPGDHRSAGRLRGLGPHGGSGGAWRQTPTDWLRDRGRRSSRGEIDTLARPQHVRRHDMDLQLYWVGLAAVAVNALTGVLDAGRKQMDLIGVVMVGTATALGGGTVRDVLLDRTVFWIDNPTYLYVALATTLVVFFAVRGLRLPPRLFLIPDAIGLALFTIVGTQIALEWQAPWLVASLLGVITGVVGGVLRDVLCNEVPLVFVRGELYASAAWLGALALIALQALGVSPVIAAWCGMAAVLATRLAAMAFRITLPTYLERK